MRKIFGLFILAFTLLLISCGGGGTKQDLNTLRGNKLDEQVMTKYHITFSEDADGKVNNAKALYPEVRDEKTKTYYEIYVASDVKSSLITYNYKLSFTDRIRHINVSAATFNSAIYEDEKEAIAQEVFNKEYGIQSLELDLGFEINKEASWSKKISAELLLASYDDGIKDLNVSIVYLPVYAQRFYKDNGLILKAYCLIPLYVGFTNAEGKELAKSNDGYEFKETKAFDYPTVDLVFDEGNKFLLPEITGSVA